VLTLIREHQTFSVFGGDRPECPDSVRCRKDHPRRGPGQSQGLRDDPAQPEGVFLFRYEPNSLLRDLDEPIATEVRGAVSPIVYRFNLGDGKPFCWLSNFRCVTRTSSLLPTPRLYRARSWLPSFRPLPDRF
jgi:polysaccharide export outer membrane protein